MRHWLRTFIALGLGIPLLCLSAWYSFSFLPHLGDLRKISSLGTESVKQIESILYPLAVASESKTGLRTYAVRQAYYSLVHEKNPGSALIWHANNALWHRASYLHFDDRQLFGIWVQCALSGCTHGLNEVAHKYFGKEMTKLTEGELAGLVAMVRNPTIFAPNTDAGKKRVNELLERVKKAIP